jgi:alanine racemase
VVHSPWQVEQLATTALAASVDIWLKLDSGMHRLGMAEAELRRQYQRLLTLPRVAVTHVMTHLACADKADDGLSQQQIAACLRLAGELGLKASVANSAALLRYPDSLADAVRPGISLYGSSPFADPSAADLGLAVTQTFSARLIAVNAVAAGESVGYGSRWRAARPSRIGVVAVGYGDGYPRHAPNGTPVAVKTQAGVQRASLAGCVSMDMITLDLTDLPAAQVGDEVELWGDHVSVDEVAACCGTISYELFCQVTARPERLLET